LLHVQAAEQLLHSRGKIRTSDMLSYLCACSDERKVQVVGVQLTMEMDAKTVRTMVDLVLEKFQALQGLAAANMTPQ
jgi:hypothetical protein